MTPSEIADLEFKLKAGTFQIEACDEQIERQAATIRELEARAAIAESMVAEANCSLFGSHSFFGDDKMHLSQAIEALKLESGNRWRALKIATDALEPIRTSPTLYDARSRAEQALARIKEV